MKESLRSTIEQSIHRIGKTGDEIIVEAAFPSSAPIFAGHFPGKPIVPAMYQIALCRKAVETYLLAQLTQVVHCRFSAECVPGVMYTAKILVEKKPDSVMAHCSIKRENVVHSKIVLLYGRQTTPG